MIGLEGAQSAHAKGMWGRVQGGVRPLLPRGYNHRKIFKIKYRKSCSFVHSGRLHKYGLLTYYSGRKIIVRLQLQSCGKGDRFVTGLRDTIAWRVSSFHAYGGRSVDGDLYVQASHQLYYNRNR
jgi:hypothetical protein